jgi:hypothetical protein
MKYTIDLKRKGTCLILNEFLIQGPKREKKKLESKIDQSTSNKQKKLDETLFLYIE